MIVIRSLAGTFVALCFLVFAVVGGWVFVQWQSLNEPLGTARETIVVERGTTFRGFVRQLDESGLVKEPDFLRVYVRAFPELANLKAGEFALTPDDSTLDIIKRVARGEVLQHSATVPEGWNMVEIARIFADAGIADEAEFLRLARDESFAHQLGVKAPTLEGYLFPDTYNFAKGYGAAGVIRAMVSRFKARLPDDYDRRALEFGLTVSEAITLASIIEKETGAESERRLISGVFHNRLKKGMRLQSDPTVIYGIENFDGNIRKKDLLTTTAYNTYRINGLPPGPIASPGLDAILATVEPASVPYLYFVSKNDGTHYFSSTLTEHNRAVDLYQKSLLRKR